MTIIEVYFDVLIDPPGQWAMSLDDLISALCHLAGREDGYTVMGGLDE